MVVVCETAAPQDKNEMQRGEGTGSKKVLSALLFYSIQVVSM